MTDDPGEFSEEEKAEYEEAWNDVDGKVLLAQILAELQAIRLAVTAGDSGGQSQNEGETTYECTLCQERVPGGDRERHATGGHRVPPGEWESVFEKVDSDE